MSQTFSYMFPAHVRFGAGAVYAIAQEAKQLWGTRILIISDQGLVAAGLFKLVTRILDDADIGYDICDKVAPNPTDTFVEETAARFRSDGHNLLIALGGGSVIDAAKGTQIRMTHPGHIRDYFRSGEGDRKIIPNMPPLIALPTTSGTGSETSAAAVLTDTRDNVKKAVYSPHIRPAVAIVDPELTLGLPPAITAATGMDALTHCIEACVCKYYSPIGKAIGLGGIELVTKSLLHAFEHGDDVDARTDMAMAAVMGGFAFGTGGGLGTVHAMAHQLSTEVGLPHGAANAILLPHVMAFNGEEHAEVYVPVARALGVDSSGMNASEAAQAAVAAVRTLCDGLAIPQNLRDTGITQDHITGMVPHVMTDVCLRQNPRKCTVNDIKELYEQAL
ncbi:MAG: iron-containing alcohol dehydrogenase [Gemmatimonadota bacterium]|nr:iron-containing alcohol dehydrogenase [Gemmatimonadota bacterium]